MRNRWCGRRRLSSGLHWRGRGGARPRSTVSAQQRSGSGRRDSTTRLVAANGSVEQCVPLRQHEGEAFVPKSSHLLSFVSLPEIPDVTFPSRIWRQVVQTPTPADFRSEGAACSGNGDSGCSMKRMHSFTDGKS